VYIACEIMRPFWSYIMSLRASVPEPSESIG